MAEQRCVAALGAALEGRTPDLLLAFATHHHGGALEELGGRLQDATGAAHVAGCTGASIVGGSREIEGQAALSVWAACLPETEIRPVHVSAARDDDAWTYSHEPDVRRPELASLLMFGDPFTFPMNDYLPRLQETCPGVRAVGGMASGGQGHGQNLLFLDRELHETGAVAVVLEGAVELRTAVSQGCRPVGTPLVVTSCRENLILRLRGQPAAPAMVRMIEKLPASDRDHFRRGAFLGLAIDPTKSQFESGDLLVRNVLGIHPHEDAIAVGDDSLRTGMTVQFMVRDAASASAELEEILAREAPKWSVPEPARDMGALLFTCQGRGTHMFRTLNHDAGCLQGALGPELPVAGFFANGEIGPIGGRNFLHGFTASIGVLRARD